jgi:molybdopterin synthase sulfur carrier subunit
MRIKILYFSSIKDKLKKSSEEINLNDDFTIKDLKNFLQEKYPEIKEILDKSMFAVNENYVTEDYKLKDGDLVALIPPVSGG